MLTVSPTNEISASGLIPLPPVQPKSVTDDELAIQVRLLRSRQLRRDDVRQKLVEYAEQQQGGAR